MKNKETKTCGECKHYSPEAKRCDLRKDIYNIQVSDKACRHFIPKPKLTVFDHITESVETLAEKLVYKKIHNLPYDQVSIIWRSTLISHKEFYSESEAIQATIEELKQEAKDE